jgi:hypothetical protein
MKKALYVAFSVIRGAGNFKKMLVKGRLSFDGKMLAESSTRLLNEKGGNLVFDLQYQIPDGLYTIQIDILNDRGDLIASGSRSVKRREMRSTFDSKKETPVTAFEESFESDEPENYEPTHEDISIGYVIFQRSPLEYVFTESRPKKSELVDSLSVRVARNEFEPITFSLYPLINLGKVIISLSDLRGLNRIISKNKIKIGYVESVQETTGLPYGKYLTTPVLIRVGNEVDVDKGKSLRFWLTIRIDDDVLPGIYSGKINISPQYGKVKSLPLNITVTPITLEEIPGVDYFMLMTYEFTELTMPWKTEEKNSIYESSMKVLRDYMDHGMTTLCLHSPFVLRINDDGTPNLEDIFAGLRAARDSGFTRPIIWYMGHLIQTAKPQHPGSIKGFNGKVNLSRLKYLVKTVSEYAKRNNCPEVIFLPIDEPDDSYQDFKKRRRDITPLLLTTIKEFGASTMLTARNYKQFKPVDYICSSEINEKDLNAAHNNGSAYWIYNNQVATDCRNPAYARYTYGYYTWRNNIDGMSSWTFQNTQNASGLPVKADTPGRDLYLAYPDPKGPLSTLKWEAVREGIDDHKLIYQLEKRIITLRGKGADTSGYENFLAEIRKKQGQSGCQPEDTGWDLSYFYQNRENLISMILDADRTYMLLKEYKFKSKNHNL